MHLARSEAHRALAIFDGPAEQAQAERRLAQAIDAWLLEALAWQAQGESAAALASFERSLFWAEPEGYTRLYLEAGTDVIPLLDQAASAGMRSKYVSKLLAAFCAAKEKGAPTLQLLGSQSFAEPLPPRELDVLHLICDGLSNREIAGRLTVTLNTVLVTPLRNTSPN